MIARLLESILPVVAASAALSGEIPSERGAEPLDPPRPEATAAAPAETPDDGADTGAVRVARAPSGDRDADPAGGDERPEESTESADGGRVGEDARPLVERVQTFYEDTEDFTARFEQTYVYQVGRTVESEGSVAFKRPAMMRWDYEAPRERAFIVDGTDLWIWTPEDHSVVRQRNFTASDLSTSITFLWGEGRLEDEFHIEREGEDRLVLTPIRPQGGFSRVVLVVDSESGQVRESVVTDAQGNENRMEFSDVTLNAGLDEERFAFEVPEGADVQELRRGGVR